MCESVKAVGRPRLRSSVFSLGTLSVQEGVVFILLCVSVEVVVCLNVCGIDVNTTLVVRSRSKEQAFSDLLLREEIVLQRELGAV